MNVEQQLFVIAKELHESYITHCNDNDSPTKESIFIHESPQIKQIQDKSYFLSIYFSLKFNAHKQKPIKRNKQKIKKAIKSF
jgi:hypothetical protein